MVAPSGSNLPAATGRYQILSLIGRGGMGEVLGAFDPHLDRYVALNNSPLLEAKGNPRVAVLRFETTNASSDLGETLAELISGELANNASVVVVERKAIDAIVKEMETQRSGLTESAAVALIGKGLNAKKVFFGSVRRLGDDLFILTVRLVDVETQRIEGYREVSCERCREQDVLSAARELRKLLVR